MIRPEDVTAAPRLIREVAEATRRSPRTKMNFVADDGSAYETTLDAFMRDLEDLAERLRRSGLERGDIVVIRGSGGSYAVSIAIVASAVAGLVAAPLVSLLGDADVDTILDLSGARALLAESAIKNRDLTAHIRRVRAERSGLVVGGIGDLDDRSKYALPRVVNGDLPPVDWTGVEEGTVGFVLFSSGTTGVPKGVMHSYATVAAEVRDFANQLDLLTDGHLLQPFPQGHIGGVAGLFMCVSTGRDMTVLNSWNAVVAFDAIERYGVTGTGTSPYFLQTLLDEREARGSGLTSLRAVESGGGRVGRELVYRAAKFGLCLSPGYGSTEHPTATTHHAADPLTQRAESDGFPLNGSEVRIIGSDDSDLPPGKDGEVILRGPEQFVGYLSGDRSSFVDGDWFRTGDLGHLTPAGALVITGRIKEIIIRGGENISMNEVEQLLVEHPSVAEAAVAGVPDVKFGERVHAFLVLKPSAERLDLEEVRRFFDERKVARFKTPEFVGIVPALPRNALGKIQRHLLIEPPASSDA